MSISWPRTVERLPKSSYHDEFNWIDWVELLCLADPDSMTSAGDVRDRAQERVKDLSEGDPEDANAPDDTEIGARAHAADKWEARTSSWFEHLKYRESAFDPAYPFTVVKSGGVDSLKLQDDLEPRHHLYLTFLFSSNMRYVMSHKKALTNSFEVVSVKALEQQLPNPATVRLFGSNPLNTGRYSGLLLDKISKLSDDIKSRVVVDESDYAPTDSGDGGLDVVAWIDPGDENNGRFLIFGQCACTEEWDSKQFSSHSISWSNIFQMSSPPLNTVFIPHCYRRADGSWHTLKDIKQTVLMDRLRLVKALSGHVNSVSTLPSFTAVRRLVQMKEDIV